MTELLQEIESDKCAELACYLESQFPSTIGHIPLQLKVVSIANDLQQYKSQCERLQRELDSLSNAAACAIAEYPKDGASPGMALLRAELDMIKQNDRRP